MNFVDLDFIDKCISQLANFTEKDKPFTRLVFSDEFIQGRAWLTQKFKELNLNNIENTNQECERNYIFKIHYYVTLLGTCFSEFN